MILDRSVAPAFKSIQKVEIPVVTTEYLTNKTPVFHSGFQNQGVLKLELVIDAGSAYSNLKGLSSIYTKMMLGGTRNLNSVEVINQFDQWGGFTEFSQKSRRLHISVFGLTRYFQKYLKGVQEILDNLVFKEAELKIQKEITKQGIRLNREKPATIASEHFRENLFGKDHFFGKHLQECDIDTVKADDLSTFHQEEVQPFLYKIFLSGDIPQDYLSLLDQVFGQKELKEKKPIKIEIETSPRKEVLVKKPESLQSTLRIGKVLFGRDHKDAMVMQVANTIFGGYFGSRLMRNIRENKGYTYGISSGVVPTCNSGYFYIGTDVVKKNTSDTLSEIKKELEILQNEKVREDELETVKNFMIGSFASGVNNSFDIMDKNKKIVLGDIPFDYYHQYIDKVKEVNPNQILDAVQKYLNYEDFVEVVVGDK